MKKLFSLILALPLIVSISAPSSAQFFLGGGSHDPNVLRPVDDPATTPPPNINTNGLLPLATQALPPGPTRKLVMFWDGQSNVANSQFNSYVPLHPDVIHQFNVNDGALYPLQSSLLGATITFPTFVPPGIYHPALKIADDLITNNKFDRIVIVALAINGTSIAQHVGTGFAANRVKVAVARLAARGIIEDANTTFILAFGLGETDNLLGTTQLAFATSLDSYINATRAAGLSGRIFIAKQTFICTAPGTCGTGGSVSVPIENAQVGAVNPSAGIFGGPDADALIGTACGGSACRITTDGGYNTHFSAAGGPYYNAGWAASFAASGPPF